MFIARRLTLSTWHFDRQQLGRRVSHIAASPSGFLKHMSKRSGDTEDLGERAVRAKVSEQQQQHSAPAAADAADADLDLLYADDSVQQQQPQQPQQQKTVAAAAAAGAAADELDLDDLYAECDTQKQQQQPAALSCPQVRSTPHQAIVAAAAAADGTPQQQQQEQHTHQAAPQPDQLDAAAAAGAAVGAAGAADGSNTPSAAAGSTKLPPAAAAPKGSGRAPPTWVEAPDLPADLDVFSNAVLLVDKPTDWTSFDACNVIKRAIKRIGISKVGHAGTLDPAATGLLIICTGSGTKSIEGFMAAHKEYSGTLRLGEGTPSLDAETPVEERLPWEHITDEQLQEAARKLTGDIQQVPPMYSALHHNGKRLHELARAGETVERPARPVTITRFDVHRDAENQQLVHFYVGCTKGTYIRTLGHDLATSLGSTGHLVALRREAIGDARVDKAWQIQDLQDKLWAAIRAKNPDAVSSEEDSSSREGRRPRGNGKGRRRGKGRKSDGGDSKQQPEGAAAATKAAAAPAATAAPAADV